MSIKIHPSSEVLTEMIGDATIIWQNCVILKGAKIGKNCNINCNVFIENKIEIGDNVTIKPGVQLWDGIFIGNNVFIGPNATFTNDLTPRSKEYPEYYQETVVKEGASIGGNATIIAGLTIGEYSLIGAGSVLTKNTNPYTLWYGNPAKQKGYITAEGEIINLMLKDKKGRLYKLINGKPLLDY